MHAVEVLEGRRQLLITVAAPARFIRLTSSRLKVSTKLSAMPLLWGLQTGSASAQSTFLAAIDNSRMPA